MKRLTESQLDPKMKRDRAMYFNFAVTKPLAKKYGISTTLLNEVRRFGVFRRLSRQEAIAYIDEKFAKGWYDKKSRNWKNIEQLKSIRKQLRDYLVTITDEQYQDMCVLTKWDWDYQGEKRKLPIID